MQIMASDHQIIEMIEGIARAQGAPKVYPMYLGFQIQQALRACDADLPADDRIIASVGELHGIGDCCYAIPVTDHNGTRYRITVEVEK